MANNCKIEAGYENGCASVGGVERIFLATFDKDIEWEVGATNSTVTGVTASNQPVFYEFSQDAEYAGLTQPGFFNPENGTVYYETDITLKFSTGLTADLRNTIIALGRAPLVAIVKSVAGLYYIAGVEVPGRASEGQSSVGTALGDMNGATLTIKFKSQNGVYILDPEVLDDIDIQ